MTPHDPSSTKSKASLDLSSRLTLTPQGELNYMYLHRGSVIVVAPAGAMRLELYQRRSMDHLSLDN